MRILMVAPPGAGKGTQAERLAVHFGIEHLASGEMLREELASASPLGEEVRRYVERGDLVPDKLVLSLVLDRLKAAAAAGGYVLDGFPRTVSQAGATRAEIGDDPDASLQAVVHLAVGRVELRRRMRDRAELEGRTDDTAAVIEHRMDVYDEQTGPLVEYYRDIGILISVNGEQAVDEVSAELIEALEHLRVTR